MNKFKPASGRHFYAINRLIKPDALASRPLREFSGSGTELKQKQVLLTQKLFYRFISEDKKSCALILNLFYSRI